MEGTAITGAKKRAVTQTSTTEEFIEELMGLAPAIFLAEAAC